MEYNFRGIEQKWQQQWADSEAYKVPNQSDKPKFYVLDMFPYPSGAGLHVGHPLGYIASDIFARYKRLKGFNVLHPMGYDAFGLPAEQYAIEHGIHPAVSTAKNIATFRSQLDKIGFSYDWSREVNTSQPGYYKWTQWIFLQLFKSWYNRQTAKTSPIAELIKIFSEEGNAAHPVPNAQAQLAIGNGQLATGNTFTAEDWNGFDEKTQQAILMEYRVAYCGYGEVNWCEALGTVLANDEVVNGVSERGGHPVIKKRLRQWYLRITEYADRLLQGLQTVDFSDAMKDMQSNWIGKSQGAEITFKLAAADRLTPGPSPRDLERGAESSTFEEAYPNYKVRDRVQFENARMNRKNSTEAEARVWEQIKNQKLGVKFRRQHPVDGFITDFACLEKGLVIEIDGGYHNNEEQQQYDEQRTAILQQKGFTLIRFTNNEVLNNVYAVRDKIKDQLNTSSVSNNVNEDQAPYQTSKDSSSHHASAPLSKSLGEGLGVRCYTTRPDTIFGVDFLVIAPEHDLVSTITTPSQQAAVTDYIAYVKSRSERERMAEKKISGVATGAYAINPISGAQVPVWISEYVLAGYGTGAIMAVPCGDERDHKFARHFGLPITNIIGDAYNGEEANATKDAVLTNSGFLNGMVMRDAVDKVIDLLEDYGAGQRKVNFKMRDAAFSRQRYWGEPFPIVWKDGVAYPLEESDLPLQLPEVENYKPGPEGEGPLANIDSWKHQEVKLDLSESSSFPRGGQQHVGSEARGMGALETNTMPGYAGSSWYFLRYMDPHNTETFADKSVSSYWNQVDLYVGGTEHAVGHLLYSRMWTKCLYDLGLITFDEPFKKLLNQGMIQGVSQVAFVRDGYYDEGKSKTSSNSVFVPGYPPAKIAEPKLHIYSSDVINEKNKAHFKPINIPIDVVEINNTIGNRNVLQVEIAKEKYPQRFDAVFITPDAFYNEGVWKTWSKEIDSYVPTSERTFFTASEVEKMSKSKYNVVNPDEIIVKYGADTFRMYEMFLGPIDQSKPWDTKGIEGVHRFLKKLWRLFYDDLTPGPSPRGEGGSLRITSDPPSPEELKVLHRTIKKIEEDTERFSYNTAVSGFMVCVNELTDLKCHNKEVLSQLLILLTPYAPHIAEELWQQCGNSGSILNAAYPTFNPQYVAESTKEYPVSINGKMRTTMMLDLSATEEEVQALVMSNEVVQRWMEGKPVKKFIYVHKKMVNVVI